MSARWLGEERAVETLTGALKAILGYSTSTPLRKRSAT